MTLVKGHSVFKVKTCFYRNRRFGPKVHMKAQRRMGMKIYTNWLGPITNMATLPIYGKKSTSPEAID